MRFRGQILDDSGAPIVGAYLYPYSFDDGARCRSVGSGAPVPPGSFESPAPIPDGWTRVEVQIGNRKLVSEPYVQRDDEPVTLVVSGDRVTVQQAGAEPPQPTGRDLARLGVDFILDFSCYHALAVAPAVRAVDFAWLAEHGYGAIEAWLIFSRVPGVAVLDAHGKWLPGGADRLRTLLDQAASFGLHVNTRVAAADLWRSGTHDSTAQMEIFRSFGARPDIANHPALLGFDPANEGEKRGKGNGPGLGWEHISSGEASDISRVARQVAPGVAFTVSISGEPDGVLDEEHTPCGPWYVSAKTKGAAFAFCSAHDPRGPSFGDNTEGFVNRLRAALTRGGLGSLPICLVEPDRNNYGQPPSVRPADQFRKAMQGAKRAGAALWCHHNGPVGKAAWWDVTRPVREQLHPIDVQVVESARGWIS